VFGSGAGDAQGLGGSFPFKHETSRSGDSGLAGPAGPDRVPASVDHHDDAAGIHGHPAAGPQTLDLPPAPPADDLAFVPDHEKGHVVAHVQHDLIV
jgi:hypothetical protein